MPWEGQSQEHRSARPRLLARADYSSFEPASDPTGYRFAADAPPVELTPDHYPLVTPRGTIAVADLSERGLYSQARYRSTDAYQAIQLAPARYDTDEPIQQVPLAAAPREVKAPPPIPRAQPSAPLKLANGPVQIALAKPVAAPIAIAQPSNASHARLIKVNANPNQVGLAAEPVNQAMR